MNRKIFRPLFFLSILLIFNTFSLFSQDETVFLNPAKKTKTVFVALHGKKAYIFEIYRIPNAAGFTGRDVLDTLTETSTGMYEGRNATLSTNGETKNLFFKSLHEQKDVTIEMVLNDGTNDPFNISLNNALLNQFAVQLANDINTRYKGTEFFMGDVVNRFYSQEDVVLPYKQFEAKYAPQYQLYADSTMNKHAHYLEKSNDLKAKLFGITPEEFNKDLTEFPSRRDLSVSYFKTVVNDLAMANPATYLKACELASPEVRQDMFEILNAESRRNVFENGPDCDVKDQLKKQRHKKVWKDIALIGIPSALIVVGAATIHTE